MWTQLQIDDTDFNSVLLLFVNNIATIYLRIYEQILIVKGFERESTFWEFIFCKQIAHHIIYTR